MQYYFVLNIFVRKRRVGMCIFLSERVLIQAFLLHIELSIFLISFIYDFQLIMSFTGHRQCNGLLIQLKSHENSPQKH